MKDQMKNVTMRFSGFGFIASILGSAIGSAIAIMAIANIEPSISEEAEEGEEEVKE